MTKNKINIGINGFGRIGRAITRINEINNDFNLVFINDKNSNIKNLAYLLKYDSTYGTFEGNVTANREKQSISINNNNVKCFNCPCISEIPWNEIEIDYLIDSSGVSNCITKSRELIKKNKFKKYFFTHCSDNADIEVVMGVNDGCVNSKHMVISNSICDSNAVSHPIKWINDKFKIINGSLTTIHPWLSYQNILDGPSISQSNPGVVWEDYALGRASISNLIPKNTTAIDAVERIIPEIKNKFISFSYRVPTPTVASSDLVINVDNKISQSDVVSLLKEKSKGNKYVNLNYESLVSKDYEQNYFSAIIDMQWLKVIDNTIKIILWYDNEWGYSARVIDLIKEVHNR
tara:strand:- start:788 stop:1828 length:1041 start_codon:yes stop_codon:yes gene_type:complete